MQRWKYLKYEVPNNQKKKLKSHLMQTLFTTDFVDSY